MIAFLLSLMLPLPQIDTYEVDICEINHVVNRESGHYVSYVVWWDWEFRTPYGYGWYVRDWRCVTDVPRPIGDVCEWHDGRLGKRIRVRHHVFREVATFHDRELENRKLLAEENRRKFK